MDQRLLHITLPLVGSTAVCLGVVLLSWRRRSRPGGIAFVLMMAANALWAAGYILEIAAPTLGGKLLWAQIQYLGIVAIPITFLLFSLRYTGRLKRVGRRHLAVLGVHPLTTLAVVWVPAIRPWLWRRIDLDASGPFPLLDVSYGPWFWLHTGYSYAVYGLAAYVLITSLVRRPGPYRAQAVALAVALLVPWIGNGLHVLDLSPLPLIDPTPLAFALTGVALFLGLLRFGLLDLLPVAWDEVIKGIRDGVAVLDGELRIVELNPVAERLLGTTAARVVGRQLVDVLEGSDSVAAQLAAGQAVSEELELGGEDGALCELRAWPLQSEHVPSGAVVVLRDVSDQRLTEAALESSERRLQVVVEQIPAVLWTVDRDLVFRLSTGSGLEALDLEPGEVVGMSLFELFGTDDPSFAPIAAHTRALHGEPSAYEFEWKARAFECHVEPLYESEGAIVGAIGVALDVSERASLERRLRQSQKMEAIGRMAGSVAHDFNNLLTAVAGYAQLAQEDLGALGDHPEAIDNLQRAIDAIRLASGRATAITGQLLAFSRKQVLQPRVVDPNAVVTDMESMLVRLSGDHVRVITQLERDVPYIEADPVQLQQVVINLVLNARDAMPNGGEIRIRTAERDVGEDFVAEFEPIPPGRYLVVSVADQGIGMDESTKLRLFEPFFTTKGEGRGTGLGLSTVYGIVKQSGGYIEVASERGEGTTLEVFFPAAPPDADPEAAPTSSEERPRGSETILLVEDEEMVRVLAARVLEKRGYRVLEAANGDEALAIAESDSGSIALVVTDVVMPGMNGKELAGRLSEIVPETPVLFISGYTGGALLEHGVIESGTAFLQKPFTPQQLSQKVREILDADGGGADGSSGAS